MRSLFSLIAACEAGTGIKLRLSVVRPYVSHATCRGRSDGRGAMDPMIGELRQAHVHSELEGDSKVAMSRTRLLRNALLPFTPPHSSFSIS